MDRANTLAALTRGDLAGAREVRLPDLAEFPRDLFGLSDTLEVLDIGGGTLTSLPHDFGRFRKLRILFASRNRFERLPPALGDCPALSQIGFRDTGMRLVPDEALPPKLRWLILTDNAIEVLPPTLGQRPRLQKMMLSGNRLTTLPDTLQDAENLELLRLGANPIEVVPAWLASLPNLAWISWAGTSFEGPPLPAAAPAVPWRDLEVGNLLGEGASGRVHQASWHSEGGSKDVALKIFKGAMTSDGRPDREVATCLAAGAHSNLTSALGRVEDHPGGDDALLMPLLPNHWRVLANPPNFESCSRDVYDAGLRFDGATVSALARKTVAALAHLHARGVLHGDFYAHNILWDGATGDCALSDFGAASLLPAGPDAVAWQRIEVRAFGLLLGELLERCTERNVADRCRGLAIACTQREVRERPLMTEVLRALGTP